MSPAHAALRFVDVVFRARIERLRHDDRSNEDTEQRAANQGDARTRLEQPLAEAAVTELRLRENVRALQPSCSAARTVSRLAPGCS